MLSTIRNKTSGLIAKILFFILICSFTIWGIGDIFRQGGRTPTLIKVGKIDINEQTFQQKFTQTIQRLQNAFGSNLSTAQAVQLGMDQTVIDNLVSQALFVQKTTQIGLNLPESEIFNYIGQEPAFKNEFGQFSRLKMQSLLAQSGLTEQDYFNNLKQNLVQNQLIDGLTSGITSPEFLLNILYQYRYERRVAESFILKPSMITSIPQSDEQTLKSFYEAHKNAYMVPEKRNALLVEITPDALVEQINPSDAELQEEYDVRQRDFFTPETRTVEQIVFKNQEEAAKAFSDLKKGIKFEQIAKNQNLDIINLGKITRDAPPPGFNPNLMEKTFATNINKGDFVEPTQGLVGWHILHVTQIDPAQTITFDKAKPNLIESVKQRLAAEKIADLINQYEDAKASGLDMTEAAEKIGFKAQKLSEIEKTNPSSKASLDSAVVDLIFSTDIGQDSNLVSRKDGGYFAVAVTEIIESKPLTFDQARSTVLKDWQEGEQIKALDKLGKDYVEKINQGVDIKKLAQNINVDVKRSQPFFRDSADLPNNIPSALATRIFDLKPNQALSFPDGKNIIIAQLKEIQPIDLKTDQELYKKFSQTITEDYKSIVMDLFKESLKKEFPIHINETRLKEILSQQP
ncbi:MAG: SurA N-terminal domain-containing protein [Alphaproteobacteria bacterium]|nr:SurA N-terminal domain-containing protein [Alphaproteobacteria bacterium]